MGVTDSSQSSNMLGTEPSAHGKEGGTLNFVAERNLEELGENKDS